MYLHQPAPTWSERIVASARTLTAILLTALLASALTVRWSDAGATSVGAVTPPNAAAIAGVPVAIEGSVVGAGDGLVALIERGAETPVAFPIASQAAITRDGQAIPADALRVGDTVRMTIDGRSGEILRLHATPAANASFPPRVPGEAALLAALGLLGGAAALLILHARELPMPAARLTLQRSAQGAPAR